MSKSRVSPTRSRRNKSDEESDTNLFAAIAEESPPSPDKTPPRLYADMYYALWDVKREQFLCTDGTQIPYLFLDYDRAVWQCSVRAAAPAKTRHTPAPQYTIVVVHLQKKD